ncbi:MAG TPA: glycosyltransferase, partial [Phycisphaerae bacterium]|nr:glycosyltransferase [Phycisphaerae bacterium]
MSETSSTTRPPETPRVSVIVPTLNEEKHIRACLDTLRAQDYDADRIEILIADGRSDDRMREIVREVAEQDGRVKLLDTGIPREPARAGRS